MADKDEVKKEDKVVSVPMSTLTAMQEQMAELERKNAEQEAKTAGLEAMVEASAKDAGEPKIRAKKDFDPKFRTVRIRKYPMAGDYDNQGYVIGWTDRGAYQEVDKTGVTPTIVDMLDIFFLGHDRDEKGKLKAEKIKMLDLCNKVHKCTARLLKRR